MHKEGQILSLILSLNYVRHSPDAGLQAAAADAVDVGLGPISAAFPNAVFPTGSIHQFLSNGPKNAAASTVFVAGLTGALMGYSRISVRISSMDMINSSTSW